ncbi:MAG: prohibitin family protein [Pseudomonadota bacterium]
MKQISWTVRFRRWQRKNMVSITLSLLIFLFVVVYFSPLIFITVPPGHAGVMWWRFFGGTVTSWTFREGTKLIPPWDKIYIYDMRLKEVTLDVDALTSDGLRVKVSVVGRYRLLPEDLGYLHRHVGPDYAETLVIPEIGNEVRHRISQFEPDALYSLRREEIENEVARNANLDINAISDNDAASGDMIEIEDILFRAVTLPDAVADAIAIKNVERHRMQQYEYILQRERLESQRKAIEASGIKAFQDTVSAGVSANYLRWKGIDATLKLAESSNAKMVVIGNQEGLPLILGNWWDEAVDAGASTGQGASAMGPRVTALPVESGSRLPSDAAPSGTLTLPLLTMDPLLRGDAKADVPKRATRAGTLRDRLSPGDGHDGANAPSPEPTDADVDTTRPRRIVE